MWTSTLDLDPKRVLITQLLRRVWSDASFSSFAPLQVQNLPRQPLPEKTWVRVRNRLAGICGSDLHMVQGDGDFRIAPAALPLHRRSYPGHEVIGEVLEVGEETQRIRVGDRVVLQYGPNCLSAGVQTPCLSCARGYYNLCEYGKLPGPHSIGGGWSEEMLLPEQQLFRLPADISDEQAVVLEPTAVAIHAVLRHLPQQNERILIIGAGTIGLLALQIVRALAPQVEISVLARHPFQIEQATRQGAAHIIYPQDSYNGIQRATNAQLFKGAFNNQVLLGGYDVIFDTVGSQKTLHHALRWARTQATVVLVGVNLHQMHIDLTPVWYREVNLIGSMGSSIETWPPATNERRSTFEVAVELIKHDHIHPEHLITHRFPLNNSQTALLTAINKEQSHAIKVIFDYSLLPPSVVPNVRASATRKRRPLAVDENTSIPEGQDISKSVPLPARVTEPAPPVASLSPLFSSSHTVAPTQYAEDELDEMEDTISAPAIAKYNKTPVNQQQEEQPFIQLENNIPQEEDAQSESEAISLETTPKIHTIESGIHTDETVITDDIALAAADEGPSVITADTMQAANGADEISTEIVQDSDAFQLASAQETPEHSAEVPIDSFFVSEESITEQSIPELLEPSIPIAQDVPPTSDSVMEKETDTISATEDTKNALLHTGESQITKIQNRPRPRKKNNRTAVKKP